MCDLLTLATNLVFIGTVLPAVEVKQRIRYETAEPSQLVANLRTWKVTDKNTTLYLEDIGTKAANKLVYD